MRNRFWTILPYSCAISLLFIAACVSGFETETSELHKPYIDQIDCDKRSQNSRVVDNLGNYSLVFKGSTPQLQVYELSFKEEPCVFAFRHFAPDSNHTSQYDRMPDLYRIQDLTSPPTYITVEDVSYQRFVGSDTLATEIINRRKSECSKIHDSDCFVEISSWLEENTARLRLKSESGTATLDVVERFVYFEGRKLND